MNPEDYGVDFEEEERIQTLIDEANEDLLPGDITENRREPSAFDGGF